MSHRNLVWVENIINFLTVANHQVLRWSWDTIVSQFLTTRPHHRSTDGYEIATGLSTLCPPHFSPSQRLESPVVRTTFCSTSCVLTNQRGNRDLRHSQVPSRPATTRPCLSTLLPAAGFCVRSWRCPAEFSSRVAVTRTPCSMTSQTLCWFWLLGNSLVMPWTKSVHWQRLGIRTFDAVSSESLISSCSCGSWPLGTHLEFPPIFFYPSNFVMFRTIFYLNMMKTKIFRPKNVFPLQTLKPGYGPDAPALALLRRFCSLPWSGFSRPERRPESCCTPLVKTECYQNGKVAL